MRYSLESHHHLNNFSIHFHLCSLTQDSSHVDCDRAFFRLDSAPHVRVSLQRIEDCTTSMAHSDWLTHALTVLRIYVAQQHTTQRDSKGRRSRRTHTSETMNNVALEEEITGSHVYVVLCKRKGPTNRVLHTESPVSVGMKQHTDVKLSFTFIILEDIFSVIF